jgi:hypothetical protein
VGGFGASAGGFGASAGCSSGWIVITTSFCDTTRWFAVL